MQVDQDYEKRLQKPQCQLDFIRGVQIVNDLVDASKTNQLCQFDNRVVVGKCYVESVLENVIDWHGRYEIQQKLSTDVIPRYLLRLVDFSIGVRVSIRCSKIQEDIQNKK